MKLLGFKIKYLKVNRFFLDKSMFQDLIVKLAK